MGILLVVILLCGITNYIKCQYLAVPNTPGPSRPVSNRLTLFHFSDDPEKIL